MVLETGCTGPTIVTAARQVGLAAGAHRAVQGEVQLVMLAQRGARHLEQRGAHRRDHLVDVAQHHVRRNSDHAAEHCRPGIRLKKVVG